MKKRNRSPRPAAGAAPKNAPEKKEGGRENFDPEKEEGGGIDGALLDDDELDDTPADPDSDMKAALEELLGDVPGDELPEGTSGREGFVPHPLPIYAEHRRVIETPAPLALGYTPPEKRAKPPTPVAKPPAPMCAQDKALLKMAFEKKTGGADEGEIATLIVHRFMPNRNLVWALIKGREKDGSVKLRVRNSAFYRSGETVEARPCPREANTWECTMHRSKARFR